MNSVAHSTARILEACNGLQMYKWHVTLLCLTQSADAAINMTLLRILVAVVCLVFLALLIEDHIQVKSNSEGNDEVTGETRKA